MYSNVKKRYVKCHTYSAHGKGPPSDENKLFVMRCQFKHDLQDEL